MYRKIAFLLAAVLCMPAYAAQTKNTMKMVSYFPVPYVAYDTVSANNAMDIGVLNQCEMAIKKGTSNLGGSACSLYLYGDPNAADLNSGLLNVTGGKLDLNSNVTNARIVSKKVQIGKDMTTIGGWLDIGLPSGKAKDYDALYISSLKNTGSSFRVTSKENGAKVNSFHMFNEISNDFPGCAGTVTWKELELAADVDTNKTYTDVYLVCDGTGEVPPVEDCQAPNGLSYTESCPEGQEGNITFTWQGEPVCNYKETNNCTDKGCENEPTVKTRLKLCSEVLGENYTGSITEQWDSETCSWKETSRTCKYEQIRKRYLSYPQSCYKACRRTDGGLPAGYSTSIVNQVMRHPRPFARCALDYQILDAIGTSMATSLPAGCSPGQECASCVLGQRYIVPAQVYCASIDTSTSDGWAGWGPSYSCYSITVVTCGEYTTPPSAGSLDCSNWNSSGSGGNVGIMPSTPDLAI